MERNYMNVNEVFPILDMINRKIKKGKNKGINFVESPLVSDDDTDVSEWEVSSLEIVRDKDNKINPTVAKQVIITYTNGAIETIDLFRGLADKLPASVENSDYYNYIMVTTFRITTEYNGTTQTVDAKITKDGGIGLLIRIDMEYGKSEEFEIEDDWEEDYEDYDNPNDFYDGTEYPEDDDEREVDYKDIGYSSGDEPSDPSPTGWEDGYEPEEPIDQDIPVKDEEDS